MNPRHQLPCRKKSAAQTRPKVTDTSRMFCNAAIFPSVYSTLRWLAETMSAGTRRDTTAVCTSTTSKRVCVSSLVWALKVYTYVSCVCVCVCVSVSVCVCVWEREGERERDETITRKTTWTLWKKYHGKQPARWVLHCYRQTPSVHLTSAGWLAVANPGIPKKEGQTVNILQISPETQPDNTKHDTSHRAAAANEYPPVPRSPAPISADKKSTE